MVSLPLRAGGWVSVPDPLRLLRRLYSSASEQVLKFLGLGGGLSAGPQVSRCLPLPGETACACSPALHAFEKTPSGGGSFVIEGWIGFPIAVADGTATGTVFLEASRSAGVRARVVANLPVDRGSYQNWIHFRLPYTDEFELEGIYSLRATLVATDLQTGQKRLFGTPRAASILNQRSEGGVVLELEDWG